PQAASRRAAAAILEVLVVPTGLVAILHRALQAEVVGRWAVGNVDGPADGAADVAAAPGLLDLALLHRVFLVGRGHRRDSNPRRAFPVHGGGSPGPWTAGGAPGGAAGACTARGSCPPPRSPRPCACPSAETPRA